MTPSPAHQPGTTTGATVDERPRFEEVLAEHERCGIVNADGTDPIRWTCGIAVARTDTDSPDKWIDAYRAHQSAALNAEVDRWLGDEGTRERVAREVVENLGLIWPDEREAMHDEVATAALAALTAPTAEGSGR